MSRERLPELEDLTTHAAPGTLLERALRSDARRRRAQRRLAVVGSVALILGVVALAPRYVGAPRDSGARPAEAGPVSSLLVPTTLDLDAPDAERVDVAGSWNDWVPQPMTAQGDHFSVSLMLPPGRYEYMFLVNGHEWRSDPRAALSHDDGFGNVNSILNI